MTNTDTHITTPDEVQGAELWLMRSGCHFNYTTQTWIDGHDHGHYEEFDSPLTFCGADLATCQSTREFVL
jgi:hypothetical protein